MSFGQATAATSPSFGFTNAVPTYPTETPKVSALDGLRGRLAGQVSRVWDLSFRARSIADDVFGPAAPQGAGAGKDAQPPIGRYSELAVGLDALDFAVSELASQLDRLTCI